MEYSSCKIFDPQIYKIVAGIRVADCMILGNSNEYEMSVSIDTTQVQDLTVSSVLNCSYCNVSFADATDQRNHYKLDWHRYNLKRALCDKQPVPEEIFDGLADEVSSISGSESENSSKEDSDSESNDLTDKTVEPIVCNQRRARGRHSKAFFENSEQKIFSVYKCLLHSKKDPVSNSSLISSMSDLLSSPKKWLIIMLGGGHFAAAIFNNGVIAEHKTFHCYTVRAKQGGCQSSRDNRGGGHPKSAGASLRRYNEQALVQHVQEIMSIWCEPVKQCQLILYRAAGRYNRGVIFGGKNPPLEKSDPRLRNIPFPTRRATLKEVKRIYDILSTVEVYGSSAEFKDEYPRSPEKRVSPRKINQGTVNPSGLSLKKADSQSSSIKKKSSGRNIDRSKARSSPVREIPGENVNNNHESSSDENELGDNSILIADYVTNQLDELKEFDDTVPEWMKESEDRNLELKKDKLIRKRKRKSNKSAYDRQLEAIQKKLVASCENGDEDLLVQTLKICDTLPEKIESFEDESKKGDIMTKKNFIDCLNSNLNNENRNTVLHLSAIYCLPEFVKLLLQAGADPTVKNKNRLTPYVISGNKETRNSFKEFASHHPDKYDYKRANIPEPLTEEMQKLNEEKKKEKNKMKRQKEKIKRKENKEKREEEKERQRFLALSDREKCALAAERRIIAAATANLKNAKLPVLSRCFLCGLDITGKVPFEYGMNRFCSVPCVKAHRQKTKSFGIEI